MTDDSEEQETVELPVQPLGVHIIHQAAETCGDDYYVGVPDDVEDWSIYDAADEDAIHAVDSKTTRDGETEVHVHAEITGKQSRKVASSTRWHPAEYETRDVQIGVTATWRPTDGLAPETTIHVEVIDGGFPEPGGHVEYDPMEHG
jgi:hypothetical protein